MRLDEPKAECMKEVPTNYSRRRKRSYSMRPGTWQQQRITSADFYAQASRQSCAQERAGLRLTIVIDETQAEFGTDESLAQARAAESKAKMCALANFKLCGITISDLALNQALANAPVLSAYIWLQVQTQPARILELKGRNNVNKGTSNCRGFCSTTLLVASF